MARTLGLKSRHQANELCRELEKQGLVIRRKISGKIHNFWAGKSVAVASPSLAFPQKSQITLPKSAIWLWEGNIQLKVIKNLKARGYNIRSVADTASHQRGIDIEAEKDGKLLWVSVKGYPQGTDNTNPSVQAGHWFKQAIFDIIEYREQDMNVKLAIALPDYPRYHSLAQKITWFKSAANFDYYWVNEDGQISIE